MTPSADRAALLRALDEATTRFLSEEHARHEEDPREYTSGRLDGAHALAYELVRTVRAMERPGQREFGW